MSVDQLKQAMMDKRAEEMPNDESRVVPGKMDLYPDPQGHTESTTTSEPEYTSGVMDEFFEARQKLLGRNFETMPASSALDKALIAANFETRDYESHSPLLQKSASPTLAEQVRQKLGER